MLIALHAMHLKVKEKPWKQTNFNMKTDGMSDNIENSLCSVAVFLWSHFLRFIFSKSLALSLSGFASSIFLRSMCEFWLVHTSVKSIERREDLFDKNWHVSIFIRLDFNKCFSKRWKTFVFEDFEVGGKKQNNKINQKGQSNDIVSYFYAVHNV